MSNMIHTPASADSLTNNHFLLVDDEKELLSVLERYLSSMGFEFTSTTDSQEALDLLSVKRFDIVITDIQMPHKDGIELLRIIKKNHADTDVILITGYSQTYTFTDVIREGATDYLEKPFTKDAFRAKIHRILKERALSSGYKQELAQRREIEKQLHNQSKALEKRVQQLDCLYRVSSIIEQKNHSLEDIFQETVETLLSALQCPESASVRLRYKEQTYCTTGFRQTPWSLDADIVTNGTPVGEITICYSSEVNADPGMALLKEDRSLIQEVGKRIGRAIDEYRTERKLLDYFTNLEEAVRFRTQELHTTQAALESVFQNIPDGILSVNKEMVVTHLNDKCTRNLDVAIDRVLHAGLTKFQEECCSVLKNTLNTQEPVTDYRIEIEDANGVSQVVLVSTSLLSDALHQTAGALLIIHDITRLADLENQLLERRRFRQMVGKCSQLQEIYNNIRKLAPVDTTILIMGESGTGKELVVETLHTSGNRANKPLIKVNCAALPENLLESELFGHIRGSFTGAVKDRAGRIQAAEGGILFLDEIGDISPRIQLKLLRFLEVKEYERVGESQTRRADVRVFAATNADLARKVQEGLFREDLYYRLKVMVIPLPPLRERRDDIPFLIDHFLAFFNKKFNKSISGASKEVIDILMTYHWPGNIRELKHVIEHGVLLSSGNELRPEHLPKDLISTGVAPIEDKQPARALTREALLNALRQTDGNKAKTARMLKLSRATLYNKIKDFNLQHACDS